MSTKNLQKILEGLAGSTEDIEASALISQDGLVVASTLHQPIDEGRLGTVLATMLSLGRDAAKELAKGGLEQILIQGEVPPIDRTPYISQRRSPSCLQNARSIHLSFAVKLLSWPKQVAHMLNLPESLDATPPALAPGFARVKLMKPAIRLQMHR
jgi:hypothetical protein|nr:roadblock/LC7 domain-containing protein [Lampropedia hyalina]